MNKSSNSRSSMFLMEIILAILFFSLVSAVCLRMFTKSHLLSTDTGNLNIAVNQAGSAAEVLKSSSDGISALKELSSEAVIKDQTAVLYFDKSWNPCSPPEAEFALSVSDLTKDTPMTTPLTTYKILVHQIDGTEIYSLTLKTHEPFYS